MGSSPTRQCIPQSSEMGMGLFQLPAQGHASALVVGIGQRDLCHADGAHRAQQCIRMESGGGQFIAQRMDALVAVCVR
jgi:hypothetical protein